MFQCLLAQCFWVRRFSCKALVCSIKSRDPDDPFNTNVLVFFCQYKEKVFLAKMRTFWAQSAIHLMFRPDDFLLVVVSSTIRQLHHQCNNHHHHHGHHLGHHRHRHDHHPHSANHLVSRLISSLSLSLFFTDRSRTGSPGNYKL